MRLQKTSEVYQIIHDKVCKALENIDNSLVRDEYKVRVFVEYTLPSLRYILTVHSLTDTQLHSLDAVQTKFLKTWLKLPQNGATPAIIYSNSGLKIHKISELYLEARTLSYASSILRGDHKVKHALNARIDRESKWSHKMKNTGMIKSKNIVNEALESNGVDGTWKTVKPAVRKNYQ